MQVDIRKIGCHIASDFSITLYQTNSLFAFVFFFPQEYLTLYRQEIKLDDFEKELEDFYMYFYEKIEDILKLFPNNYSKKENKGLDAFLREFNLNLK